MKTVESLIVQVVVRTRNEAGELIAEDVSQPVQLLRGRDKDVWVKVDQLMAAQEQARPMPVKKPA